MKAQFEIVNQDFTSLDIILQNTSDNTIEIVDPNAFYKPLPEWEYSKEAYQIAVLKSFQALEIELFHKGIPVTKKPVITLASHTELLPFRLEKNQKTKLRIPLYDLFDIEGNKEYFCKIIYGRDIKFIGELTFKTNNR